MSHAKQTLQEFGQSMGISSLAPNESGKIQLSIKEIGDLHIELKEDYVILYLRNKLSYPSFETFKTILTVCHYKEGTPFMVNPGIYGDDELSFCVRIHENELTLPVLQEIIDTLDKLHRKIASIK